MLKLRRSASGQVRLLGNEAYCWLAELDQHRSLTSFVVQSRPTLTSHPCNTCRPGPRQAPVQQLEKGKAGVRGDSVGQYGTPATSPVLRVAIDDGSTPCAAAWIVERNVP